MAGFGDLVNVLRASGRAAAVLDAKIAAVDASPLEKARADVERLTREIEAAREPFDKRRAMLEENITTMKASLKTAPRTRKAEISDALKKAQKELADMLGRGDRTSGLAAQLEKAKATLTKLEKDAATAKKKSKAAEKAGTEGDDEEKPSPETKVGRIALQMRTMTSEVTSHAAEVERTLETLSTRADEVSAEVQVKISKALAAILDPGSGTGVSGSWDKTTGQFLGGALSFERAREMVDLYNQLKDLQATKLNAFQQFYVNDSLQKTAQQFTKEFGSKLGDIRALAKQLREYLAATAAADRRELGPTSGTLATRRVAQAPATSLAVLRWSGGLR